jgi:hypothetical protein
MPKRILFFTGAGLVCLILLVFTLIPVKQVKSQLPFRLEDGTSGEIILAAPAYLRQGDWAEVEMLLKFDIDHLSGESIKVKASLQSANMEVEPAGEVTAVIPANGRGPFEWQVSSNLAGKQSANAWCFRQDPTRQSLILAREIPFVVKSIFGVRYSVARWLLGGLTLSFCLMIILSATRYKNRIQ